MQEIERKFLVRPSAPFREESFTQTKISQGYLNSDPDRTVRVRLKGASGFLTIKGRADESGLSRFEWEQELKRTEAASLLELCEPGLIQKIRYEVRAGDHVIEVDEFFGENEGLIFAEVELRSVDDVFEPPEWLGDEVTGNPRYYNASLRDFPFSQWEKA